MANIGYVQITRRCNQSCRFCSNPPSGLDLTAAEACARIDDLAGRGYDGVIFTGGEPTLVPWLVDVVRHAIARGIAPRIITNGHALAGGPLLDSLVSAGLRHVHVSLYSHDAAVHDALTRNPGSHANAVRGLERSLAFETLAADVNCVINRYNATALDRFVFFVLERFPRVRHVVFNNLDARMERVVDNRDTVPRLADMELSLARALRLASENGMTFRVERVPLCYMAEWAHASTETRKIVKDEERIVHFLDEKGMVRQQKNAFRHEKADACACCGLGPICAGVDGLGEFHDPRQLAPVFLDPAAIFERIRGDGC
jgi:MoaA/NifB/PqqE/SkfB family radical SAM enzyme